MLEKNHLCNLDCLHSVSSYEHWSAVEACALTSGIWTCGSWTSFEASILAITYHPRCLLTSENNTAIEAIAEMKSSAEII